MDLENIKRVAIKAAYDAGKILNRHFGNLTHINKKGAIDLVTAADLESEEKIIETIRQHFPRHAILAEESGTLDGDDKARWIIDPLDGTTNFAHSLGIYSVSIAFALNNEIVTGLVFNPQTGELFTAIHGQGAQLNGCPIHVSSVTHVSDSLLTTGFPYNVHAVGDTLISRFARCLSNAQGIRRLGSAALDLCFVACGRFDGFWEDNLKPWDTAAGMLIAREAGGTVTDYNDRPYHIDRNQILATNNHIHQEMVALLNIKDAR